MRIESKDTAAPVCIKHRFRSVGAKKKMFEIKKKKKGVIMLSVGHILAAFPQFYHLLCGSWISGGLVVWAERGVEGGHVQLA